METAAVFSVGYGFLGEGVSIAVKAHPQSFNMMYSFGS